MKLTEQDINKLKGIGLITSTYPSKKIIEDLELDTVDLNKIFKYITHVDSTEKIEQWLSGGPGPTPIIDERYLSFEILHGGDIIWMCTYEDDSGEEPTPPVPSQKTIDYSINDGEWISVTSSLGGEHITVNTGDIIRFRGNNASYSFMSEDPEAYGYSSFVNVYSISGEDDGLRFKIFGNIMSLISKENFKDLTSLNSDNRDCFLNIFMGNTSVVDASDLSLPANILVEDCYFCMFSGCTSLTTAPELPATILADGCYSEMFYGCTALTTAPELPATTLMDYCYYYMFHGCTSLTSAPALPATTLADGCYAYMFYGCASLTIAPELPVTTLAADCYAGMFGDCTSLTTTPELPATTLTNYCYYYMFKGCTSLTTAPELPATTLAESCYDSMFHGCTFTTAPELPATELAFNCYSFMFIDCTSLMTPPEFYIIPGTGTSEDIDVWKQYYMCMFQHCDNSLSSYFTEYPGLWNNVLKPTDA